MRVVLNSDVNLIGPVYADADGVAVDADALPTVVVHKESDPSTNLAAPVVTKVGNGLYNARLNSGTHTDTIDNLVVTWTADVSGLQQVDVTVVPVVSRYLFTTYEMRQFRGLDDTTKFPTWMLEESRDAIEDYVEELLRYALSTRYTQETFSPGSPGSVVVAKWGHIQSIRSAVDQDGTTLSVTNWSFNGSGVLRADTLFNPSDRITVGYQHGLINPGARLKLVLADYLREDVLERLAHAPNNMISETFDGRTVRHSTPDPSRRRWTGKLNVDPAIQAFSLTGLSGGIA